MWPTLYMAQYMYVYQVPLLDNITVPFVIRIHIQCINTITFNISSRKLISLFILCLWNKLYKLVCDDKINKSIFLSSNFGGFLIYYKC